MGGAVACRSGLRLASSALVWAGLSWRARPSFSSGRSLGTALEAGEWPGFTARRRRSRAGAGRLGLGAANGPRRPGQVAGQERRRGHSPCALRDCGGECGGGGRRRGATLLPAPSPPSPANASSYCVHGRAGVLAGGPGRAYSVGGETEARFGTWNPGIPESSPAVPAPRRQCLGFHL